MITNKQDNFYKAFGLKLLSQIQFPELIKADETIPVDIEVILDKIPEDIDLERYHFLVSENGVSFVLPGVATFRVQEGRTIIVSPINEGKEGQIRLLILGTCIGIILLQRKILPLHGSCVVINNRAYAIIGEQGAGKSTLASVFKNKGFKLLTDDLIAVMFDSKQQPYVIPSYPQQKLWENSLDHFGMKVNDYSPLFERENKYAVPAHDYFVDHPYPLVGIYQLEKTNEEQIIIKETEGIEKIKALYLNTYRNFLVPQLNLTEWHFNQSIRIINSNNMFKIERPTNKFTGNEIADMILNTIKGGNSNDDKYALTK